MLKLENVSKIYRTTEVETRALDAVSFEVAAGEFLAVMGPSADACIIYLSLMAGVEVVAYVLLYLVK